MANLTAKFRLIDEMSSKLDHIAQSGKDALSQWEQAGSAIDNAFDSAGVRTASTSSTIDSATQSMNSFTSKADEAADALDKFEKANKEAEDGLDDLGEATDETRKKSEDFDEQNRETTEGLQELEELLVAAGIVKGLEAIGRAFVSTVEDAIEFESAITGVYKTVDGTPEQLAAISDGVKDLSLVIPSTTTEIAAVAEAAGQLGIATEDIMSFTEVMINLGESTNLSSDEAASSLAKFANITKMNAAEYENLGSTVVALGNNFATTEADIVAMATRMASAGSLAGLTEAEILALAASVSSVGIEADAGGSSMSTLLSKITLAVETGSESLEQYASVANMTAEEFQRQWGENAVDALYAFIAGLNDTSRNGASATAILDEMGITEIRLSNAVKALAANHEGLSDAVDLANGAWVENTALATEANTRYSTLESKLAMTKNAATNLSTAVGEVFTPTVGAASDVLSGMLNGLTGFVKDHPTVVKAVAAITAGVATFTAGIVAYIAVTKLAKIAQAAFNAVAMANPYVFLATAVVGATVALGAFAVSLANSGDESEKLTESSKQQARELKKLESEYEKACKTYGETSEEASRLRYEMDDLQASFEANRQTVEEFVAECDAVQNNVSNMVSSYNESKTALKDEELGTLALIQKLEDLAKQTDKTAASEKLMKDIIEQINSRVPSLALNYDDVAKKADTFSVKVREAAIAYAESKKSQAKLDAYADAVIYAEELDKLIEEAEHNLIKSIKRDIEAPVLSDRWFYNAGLFGGWLGSWATSTDEYRESLEKLKAAQEENNKIIAETEAAWEAAEKAEKNAAETPLTYADAAETALTSVRSEVEELCLAYDEAYTAARESIDGQIGLFQQMVVEAETSVEEMQGAWESQIQYLTTYRENIKKAMEYGLDEDLITKLSDGSEESMANLDTIISKVEELGGTSEEAKNFVKDFNAQFQEVETAKDEFAGTVAEMETDFTEKMLDIEEQLYNSIDNMNLSDEAAEAAKSTMKAYVDEILSGGQSAIKAAEDAAQGVLNAIAKARSAENFFGMSGTDGVKTDGIIEDVDSWLAGYANGTGTTPGFRSDNAIGMMPGIITDGIIEDVESWLTGYASGTPYAAPGVAVVGENGPELVEFAGGERVYPADETSRILANAPKNFGNTEGKSDSKTIHIDINGSGAIEVDGSMDEDTVVGILYNHLKPVLTSIVKQEIFEEGDLAYDF